MRILIICSLLLSLVACAVPKVEKNRPGFNINTYHTDVGNCRGKTVFRASATSVSLAVAGSIVGGVHSFPSSFIWWGGWEAAVIGAALGAVIGFGAGAIDSYKKYNGKVFQCLRGKGYTVEEG